MMVAKKAKRSPANRHPFTEKWISKLPFPEIGRRVHYYDTRTKGLGLRVEDGTKKFFWHRKTEGNKATFKMLGVYGDIALKDAEDAAAERNGKLSKWKMADRETANPFQKSSGKMTFKECVEDYVERKIIPARVERPDKGAQAAKMLRYLRDHYAQSLNGRRLSEIRRKHIVDMHFSLRSEYGGHIANRVIQLIRAAFYFAIDAENHQGENPAARIKLHEEKSRKRRLEQEEIDRLITALDAAPNADLKDFALLSLVTAARKSDVLSMRWQDIKPNEIWYVPHAKGNTQYEIPLVPEALEVLARRRAAQLASEEGQLSEWVFPSFGKSGHLIDLKSAWAKVLKDANLVDVRQHDLRRTLASKMAEHNVSQLLIGRMLGHRDGSSATVVYTQPGVKPVRKPLAAAAKSMLKKKKTPLLKAANA